MSKAILLSIRPKWCELIASGKKTIEVRKTRPKLETPFKCYIYETKGKVERPRGDEDGYIYQEGRGAVVGEFVCDRILDFFISSIDPNLKGYPVPGTGLTDREIMDYLGNGNWGYGWHISALKMYDEPKTLSEFHSTWETIEKRNRGKTWVPMEDMEGKIRRPPQSYMYVEELTT